MTEHTFLVLIQRTDKDDPIQADTITFYGEDYDTFDGPDALPRIMPGGGGPQELDLSIPGFARFGATLVPSDKFESLKVELLAKGK